VSWLFGVRVSDAAPTDGEPILLVEEEDVNDADDLRLQAVRGPGPPASVVFTNKAGPPQRPTATTTVA